MGWERKWLQMKRSKSLSLQATSFLCTRKEVRMLVRPNSRRSKNLKALSRVDGFSLLLDWYKKNEKRGKGWSDDLLMQWSSTKRGKWKAGGQIADRNSELSSTVQLNPTPASISRCLANWDKRPKADECAKPVVRSQLRTQLNSSTRPNVCFDPTRFKSRSALYGTKS